MSVITRPMLAATLEDISNLKMPIMCSQKLDGIRCLRIDSRTLSRRFLEIPNRHIQKLTASLPDGLDGELMLEGKTFNQVQSAVMSEDGEPDFTYCVFDYVSTTLKEPYSSRMTKLASLSLPSFCQKIIPTDINSVEELNAYEEKCLAEGHEGVMVRSPSSPYKCGRSSVKQGYLLKIKRFKDSEAVVIGFVELLHNANEASVDELGHTKRSSAKANMELAGSLGKFLVREIGNTPWKGKEFAIGTGRGLTQELRKQIWDDQAAYLGKVITYTYQSHGLFELPRLPIWRGFRSPEDMDL